MTMPLAATTVATIPLAALTGFAAWTLFLLLGTVGTYRWSRILTGRAPINAFGPDSPHGSKSYQRAMRAHANCIENLPIFASAVLGIVALGLSGFWINTLSLVILFARIGQSLIHVAFDESILAVAVRFSFYFAQVISLLALLAFVALAL